MAVEIHAFSLDKRLQTVSRDANLEDVVNELEHEPGNGILWKHPNIGMLKSEGLNGFLHGLLEKPEDLLPFMRSSLTPTGLRTYNFPVSDSFGESFYTVKGVGSPASVFSGIDVLENRRHILDVRFKPEEAGRYKIEGASADLGGFLEISKYSPDLLVQFNAPIWQPLLILDAKEPLVVPHRENGDRLDVEVRTVNLRRLPFTPWRVEDVLTESTVSEGRKEIDRLRRVWGFDTSSQVFLRAINRWASSQNMLTRAQVRHVQVFDTYKHSPTKRKVFAWLNPHNIALDGSTGDLANSRKYRDYWGDFDRGRREAAGGFIMYLLAINKIEPRLLEEGNPFADKSLEVFLESLDTQIKKDIQEKRDFDYIAEAATETYNLARAGVDLDLFLPGRSPVDMYMIQKEWMPFMTKMSRRMQSKL